jgi:putative methyltransferase (TIGR04325 family)
MHSGSLSRFAARIGTRVRAVSILDLGARIGRNIWRIPLLGDVLALDYERSFARGPKNRFRGVFPSFASAVSSIPRDARVGYDHVELSSMYRDRMSKACESDYAVLFWLRKILAGERAPVVYDFGGHVGVSFHGFRAYLEYPEGLRWVVYDMPAITRVGEELARERSASQLSFTNAVEDARDCTVFFSAGALQYCEEELVALLARAQARPRHIVLNKLPVYDGESFVTVQSTGRAFHAYRIFNREELVRSVTALGYQLVDDWQNREQHCEIPFTRGRDIEAYSGFYFTLAS